MTTFLRLLPENSSKIVLCSTLSILVTLVYMISDIDTTVTHMKTAIGFATLVTKRASYERFSPNCLDLDLSPNLECGFMVGNESMKFCTDPQKWRKSLLVSECDWQKYTRRGAIELLQGKHIVFVGDSRLRYQYVCMIFWLENGYWPPDGEKDGFKSPVKESLWGGKGGWRAFFKDTAGYMKGNEYCDCYRNDHDMYVEPIYENRFYYNERYNLRLSYFVHYKTDMWAGHKDIHGHYGFPPYQADEYTSKGDTCHSIGDCKGQKDWALTLTEALNSDFFTRLGATDLFMSFGWLPNKQINITMTDEWANGVKKMRNNGINVYKLDAHSVSHPPHKVTITKQDYERVRNLPPVPGQINLDLFKFTKTFADHWEDPDKPFVDEVHFEAWVYEELSQWFLRAIDMAEEAPMVPL
ncbi:hypothetical protein SARC_08736 [Sphaeroforma arctica JP610]|uniref:Uncharacterized protein n=1 Tax=Sphaeroforma arctica JP610 TaxID=667725 RepID=A0A0L0FPW3_9EUKA|nr:hypothetical protein SARC_08736 [Sphaeroforma arctica JP610]KNC78842.1 hypothetical protein SARC_08736 [Sphaeroforma arctica JP610]|eukprot:XP_014152744.1 hypothetical protein SARC_08736 [Sphaeroforma arctica JP610]